MPIPLAALIPVITALAPYAGRLIGNAVDGKRGKEVGTEVGQQVQHVVNDIFGTTQPDEVERLAREDPAKAAELRVRMMEVANGLQIAEVNAQLEDLKSARNSMVDLVRGGSALGYAPAIISSLITLGFFGILWLLVLETRAWDERQATIISVVVGALAAGFNSVIQFWLGSSIGSKRAGETVASQAQQAIGALASRNGPSEGPQAVAIASPGGTMPAGRPAAPAVAVAPSGAVPPGWVPRPPMGDAPGAADRLNDEAWRTAREG